MPEIISLGETMAVMSPIAEGRLSHVGRFDLRIAGAESNTAIGISRLGHSSGWISAVGDDELGRYVLSAIEGEGVDVSHCRIDQKHRTGLMIKEFIGGKTTVYYYRENSAASRYSKNDLPTDYLADAKIIHITGITPVLSTECMGTVNALIAYAKDNGKLLSFDPNLRKKIWGDTDYLPYLKSVLLSADIALLGLSEAQELLGLSEASEVAEVLIAAGVKYVAVKDGDRGAVVGDAGGIYHIPPIPCNSIDPVGAGDGFNSGFLCGILEHRSVKECGMMGGIVGAMATETNGDVDGYPTRAVLDKRLREEFGL